MVVVLVRVGVREVELETPPDFVICAVPHWADSPGRWRAVARCGVITTLLRNLYYISTTHPLAQRSSSGFCYHVFQRAYVVLSRSLSPDNNLHVRLY